MARTLANPVAKKAAKKAMAKNKGKPAVWTSKDDAYIGLSTSLKEKLVPWQYTGVYYVADENKWRVRSSSWS